MQYKPSEEQSLHKSSEERALFDNNSLANLISLKIPRSKRQRKQAKANKKNPTNSPSLQSLLRIFVQYTYANKLNSSGLKAGQLAKKNGPERF